MRTQVNKHRKEVDYQVGNQVWLSSRNIKSTRPCKDLEDKQLGPYRVVQKVEASYRLQLPKSMKIHDVFSPKLLRPYARDPLPGQEQVPPRSITTEEGDEYEVDDIVDSRRYYGRLQYKVKWHNVDRDDEWYYADQDEFKGFQEVVEEYHKRYPRKPR